MVGENLEDGYYKCVISRAHEKLFRHHGLGTHAVMPMPVCCSECALLWRWHRYAKPICPASPNSTTTGGPSG